MTDKTDPAIAAINDARALLDTLLASDWNDAYVVSGETAIFLARPQGRANPMRIAPVVVAPLAVPQGREVIVKAPHVATMVSAAAIGQSVAAGDRIAVISVLDEDMDVTAKTAGTVVAIAAAPGSLLEFDTPILTLRDEVA